jgi:hypothetical protein
MQLFENRPHLLAVLFQVNLLSIARRTLAKSSLRRHLRRISRIGENLSSNKSFMGKVPVDKMIYRNGR